MRVNILRCNLVPDLYNEILNLKKKDNDERTYLY